METSKEYSASCVIKDTSSDQLSVHTPAAYVEGEQTTRAMNVSLNVHGSENKKNREDSKI